MNDKEKTIQNLHDAGCNKQQIENFLQCECTCCIEDQIKMLRLYRIPLMDELHKSQEKVDCLDYLLYQLEKEKRQALKRKDVNQ